MSELEDPEIETLHVDLATGGRPLERVMEAFLTLPGNGRGWIVDMEHDKGCPTIESDILDSCSCEILRLVAHTTKRPVFRTSKVGPEWQAVGSVGGSIGWKPPLLTGDVPAHVRNYWTAVWDTMQARLPDWERDYWARRIGGEEEPDKS